MKSKPQLNSGRFTQGFTQKDAEKLWAEVTTNLNSMGGAVKSWQSWRKCWQDIRSRTKMKISIAKQHANKTGGGPPIPKEDTSTSLEEDICSIIKTVSTEGHDVLESIAEFDFDEYTDKVLPLDHRDVDNVSTEVVTNVEVMDCRDISETLQLEKENLVQNASNPTVSKKSQKRRIPKKRENYENASQAATSYKDYLKKKIEIKQQYYEQKIAIMKEALCVKKKKCDLLQSIYDKCSAVSEYIINQYK